MPKNDARFERYIFHPAHDFGGPLSTLVFGSVYIFHSIHFLWYPKLFSWRKNGKTPKFTIPDAPNGLFCHQHLPAGEKWPRLAKAENGRYKYFPTWRTIWATDQPTEGIQQHKTPPNPEFFQNAPVGCDLVHNPLPYSKDDPWWCSGSCGWVDGWMGGGGDVHPNSLWRNHS